MDTHVHTRTHMHNNGQPTNIHTLKPARTQALTYIVSQANPPPGQALNKIVIEIKRIRWWSIGFGDLENVVYPFITITPKAVVLVSLQSSSTC